MADWYLARTAALPVAAEDEPFFAHYLRWAQPFAAEVQGRIGCVPGMALHLWHGDPVIANMAAGTRSSKRYRFDPATDLGMNGGWLWEWASAKAGLHRDAGVSPRGARDG